MHRSVASVLVLTCLCYAAAPPGQPTPEWIEQTRKADALYRRLTSEVTWGLLSHDQLITRLREVIEVERQVYGRINRNAPKRLKWVADRQEGLRRWDDAIATRRAVVEQNEALYGPRHWRSVDSRYRLKQTQLARHRTPEQLRKHEEGLRLSMASKAAFDEGDHQTALRLMERSVALCKEVLGEDHNDHGIALNNLALIYLARGDLARGLPMLRRALAIRKAGLGENHPDYAQTLFNLGSHLTRLGHAREALPLLRQAVAVSDEAGKEGRYEYGVFVGGLGEVYLALGDLRAALPLFRQSAEIVGTILGPVHPLTAEAKSKLGVCLGLMGDTTAALPLMREVLAVTRATRGSRHPEYFNAINNLAMLAGQMKRYDEAARLMEECVALRRRHQGERHPEYARSLSNLGGLSLDRREFVAALPVLRRSLDAIVRSVGTRHPDYASTLDQVAFAYHADGRPLEALAASEQAVRLRQAIAADSFLALSERGQLDMLERLRPALHLRLSLPDASPTESYVHALGWKGAVFSFQHRRRLFHQVAAEGGEAGRLAVRLEQTTRRLAAASLRTSTSPKALRELTDEKERLEGELARRSESFARLSAPATPAALADALPPGAVLVDLLIYLHHDETAADPRKRQVFRIAAWITRQGRKVERLDLGPASPILKDLLAWRDALLKGDDDAVVAARIKARLWSPLERYLAAAKVVLISPDYGLGLLPFGALPGPRKGTYLIEERAIAVLPVPARLPAAVSRPAGPGSLLVVGDVDFNAERPGEPVQSVSGLRWGSLPATRPEADAVARHHREATVLTGRRAAKPAVREALIQHRYAHLATHGFFAPPTMRSALDRDGRDGGVFDRSGVSGWHPGLLSGVVLAGANRPTDEDDGILTALEIAEMDLSGMELAVLSACETTIGLEAGGEGMLGLQRAFAMAGAKSVVSSLWSVNDAATSVLMERFYHHLWTKKLSKLEALRQAQIDVLKRPELVEERRKKLAADRLVLRGIGKASAPLPGGRERRSPPAWWAAWQLSGDWR